MSNRAIGNSFEGRFCQMLFDKGFWVHNLAQNNSGQPADVIAVKGSIGAYLIDCKVCSRKGFALSRIEPNQWSAMKLWDERITTSPVFALELPDGTVWMIWLYQMQSWSKTLSVVLEKDIRSLGTPFDKWVELICER